MDYLELNKNILPIDNDRLVNVNDDISSFSKNDIENIINQIENDTHIFIVRDISESLINSKKLFSIKPNIVLQLKITEEPQLNKINLFKTFDCDKYLMFELDKDFIIYGNDKRLQGIKFATIKTTNLDYAKRLMYCCNVNDVPFSVFNTKENKPTIVGQIPEILNKYYKIIK